MDGNGRWATNRSRPRVWGHIKGSTNVRKIVTASCRLNLNSLTLYAFSTENWNRPKFEVDKLMNLLVSSLKKEIKTLQDNKIKLSTIGTISSLPKKAQKELAEVKEKTKDNTHMNLTLALSYGSREEILQMVKGIGEQVASNQITPEDITTKLIEEHLYTNFLPDVDLLIRTSGEQRISNFLLWQIAYAELFFTEVLWPDFRKKDLLNAIHNYQNRERRFGKTSEQLS